MNQYIVVYTTGFHLEYMSYTTKEEAYKFAEKLLMDTEMYVDKNRIMIIKGSQIFFEILESRNIQVADAVENDAGYNPEDLG